MERMTRVRIPCTMTFWYEGDLSREEAIRAVYETMQFTPNREVWETVEIIAGKNEQEGNWGVETMLVC